MGDEFKQRTCPECGDRLSLDARRCVCGWGSKKAGKGEDGPRYDHSCRWQYGNLACHYPVGFFGHGETRGLCIFHRATDKGHQAADIAKESQTTTQEQYLALAAKLMYGKGDNPYVARLRASLKSTKPGNVGALAKWIAPMREPGEDEAEAA